MSKFEIKSRYLIYFQTNNSWGGWLWHWMTLKGWYANKQRNQKSIVILPNYRFNNTTAVLLQGWFGIEWPLKVDMQINKEIRNQSLSFLTIGLIVPLLSYYKDGFGIEWPTKVDMPINKEIRNQSLSFLTIGLIVPLLSYYKDGFGIEWPTKVDMPINKEIRNQSLSFLTIGLIVPLLSYYKDGFGIEWPTKVDMPLTPVALLRSLSGKYPWERYDTHFSSQLWVK